MSEQLLKNVHVSLSILRENISQFCEEQQLFLTEPDRPVPYLLRLCLYNVHRLAMKSRNVFFAVRLKTLFRRRCALPEFHCFAAAAHDFVVALLGMNSLRCGRSF